MLSEVENAPDMMLVSNPLEEPEWLFPVAECLHILGFALSIGTIAIVDFCMLGIGPVRKDAGKLASDLALWTIAGLVDMLFSGMLLFVGNNNAAHYWYNAPFRFKMVCLITAIVYHYTVHRKAIARDISLISSRLVAALSLALWLGVLTGGLFIGFAVA